ncbi:MAG TPA: ribosome recycling factor [Bdellovibrionales bacterium]|nr:MAG: ribosome recycling factor [Bdellovibrionales bacterium GWA1_52_35]OFZ34645.1 MAG: ribosome recycling factor [Bdellovibrionales bacterium GWC1_52_8]HAR42559.1 ribosome recycling factor [Bdellovibrionales bacterium]HCM40946.1 ribosome recycling factor [Bdellovibrionales bacterium]
MSKAVIDAMAQHMDKSIQSLKGDLGKLRTGRASATLVEPVHVDYYGSPVPLNQIANVTTPDARTIQIAPWEAGMVGAIEKAIMAANLGLTPQNDGKVVRIPLPPLTEERRKDMTKLVKKMGEETKVAIRNHRRDANEEIKKAEKGKTVSEDEAKKLMDQIQKKTDEKTAEVDKVVAGKEKEIMTV